MTQDKARRVFHDDIDGVLDHYGEDAQVVQLWWCAEPQTRWVYIGRLRLNDYRAFPDSFLELVQSLFGGGWYRARIYGQWDPTLRREEYLQQVSFGIGGPPTAETLSWVRRA